MSINLPAGAPVWLSETAAAQTAEAGGGRAPVTNSRARKRQAGFTLIEVLVSLTILSISLGVLLAVFLQGLDRARESRNEASARALAQSLLVQAKMADNPAIGTSVGKTSDFLWRLQVLPYGSAADQAAWQEGAGQIVATVSWQGDGGMRSISLSTLRLLPKAGE
ncbi:MAG TPA: type II secretion system protein [Rhizomicrobium sp.]|nr:type II secretion system protein [Rhizomicrobium sp.]